MSYTRLKTYIRRPDNSKSYIKDSPNDNAFGLLKCSAFGLSSEEDNKNTFQQYSYENEINLFAERLLNGMSTVLDEDGEIERYIFEDRESFDERHLLWACFDLLIKADLTIKQLKQERMDMVNGLIEARSPIMTSSIGDIPINSEGMSKTISEISRLTAENNNLKGDERING